MEILWTIINWLYILPLCIGCCITSILNFCGRDWKTSVAALTYSVTPILNIYFAWCFITGLFKREKE